MNMNAQKSISKLGSIFKGSLTKDVLDKFKKSFLADEKNLLAQNVCTKQDPFEVAVSRKRAEETQHVYNTKVSHIYCYNILNISLSTAITLVCFCLTR